MDGVMLAMAVFALAGAITPGPVNILALRYGVGGGMLRPLGFVFGASASYCALVWLSGKGAGPLLVHPWLVRLAQWSGAIYLGWLSWRIASAPPDALDSGAGQQPASLWHAIAAGGAAQALNPKAWLVALSGVALFVSSQANTGQALLHFCVVSLLACLSGVGCWAVAGKALKGWLTPPHRQRWCNRVLGAALGLSAVFMLR